MTEQTIECGHPVGDTWEGPDGLRTFCEQCQRVRKLLAARVETATLSDFLKARLDEAAHERLHTDGCLLLTVGFGEGWCDCDSESRALREVEARRLIVALAESDDDWRYGIHAEAIGRVLRHLAAVYDNHPDYREEWRP